MIEQIGIELLEALYYPIMFALVCTAVLLWRVLFVTCLFFGTIATLIWLQGGAPTEVWVIFSVLLCIGVIWQMWDEKRERQTREEAARVAAEQEREWQAAYDARAIE